MDNRKSNPVRSMSQPVNRASSKDDRSRSSQQSRPQANRSGSQRHAQGPDQRIFEEPTELGEDQQLVLAQSQAPNVDISELSPDLQTLFFLQRQETQDLTRGLTRQIQALTHQVQALTHQVQALTTNTAPPWAPRQERPRRGSTRPNPPNWTRSEDGTSTSRSGHRYGATVASGMSSVREGNKIIGPVDPARVQYHTYTTSITFDSAKVDRGDEMIDIPDAYYEDHSDSSEHGYQHYGDQYEH